MSFRFFILITAMAVSSSLNAQQFLPVKGVVNARELGGYPVQGGTVRSGLLLRTAHLADATDADIRYLSGLPVVKVIDFRMEEEKKGSADRQVPGADHIALPVDASGNAAAQASEREKKRFTGGKKFDYKKIIMLAAFNDLAKKIAREMYPTLFFDPGCQKQYAEFFRIVLSTENGAVLFHCTQGKDRAGIASALLLAALGASRETIIADFDATNRVYEADVRKYTRRVKFWGGKEEEIGVVKAILGCNTDNFVKVLDRIDAEYGSLESYLEKALGVSAADREVLRGRYLSVSSDSSHIDKYAE